ncbi:hypothetical protein, partial [Rhizobium sp.]|uniref:hypothetical protein n=1 Tax=Rhizobium sp. TaxID=391 RepID=UPI0028ACD6AD
ASRRIEIAEGGTRGAGIMAAGIVGADPMTAMASAMGTAGIRAVLRRRMMVRHSPAGQGPLPAMVIRAVPGQGLAMGPARAGIVAGGVVATATRMVAGRAEVGAICATAAAAMAAAATRPALS